MSTQRVKFQTDSFRKARGGRSRWLLLRCEKCGHDLCLYQKDGPGILKRIYVDRITALPGAVFKKNMECVKCGTMIGVGMVYEKEKRPAYRLFSGALTKELLKESEVRKYL